VEWAWDVEKVWDAAEEWAKAVVWEAEEGLAGKARKITIFLFRA
jgi:hypothetical protein